MRVFIFGGTRGLGLALAKHYLQNGHTVAIAGRNPAAAIAIPNDANLHCYTLDIGDSSAVHSALNEYAAAAHVSKQGLDLVIVTAGLYFNDRNHALDAASSRAMLETNVNGLSHVLQHASAIMLQQLSCRLVCQGKQLSCRLVCQGKQNAGQIAAVASIAGLLSDYPGASVYSATKRSVLQLCDTYQRALIGFGIHVTTIIPGYIDTERLRELNGGNAQHKPFLVSEAFAVEKIVAAIAGRAQFCVFPWQMHLLVRVIGVLPKWLQKMILLRKS